jgi:hypothetical protein
VIRLYKPLLLGDQKGRKNRKKKNKKKKETARGENSTNKRET